MATSPIRIGFIGLSASGGWASGAHLPYLKQSGKYKIVALCNSSVDAAKAAITHHSLPPDTKTYGSPADLARDPDIDLVVCSVRVDRHYETIKPALEAGKNVYVEWPLGANLAEAEELAEIARKKGVTTMVGLQARRSPFVNAVRELVESGRIGKVLSSTVVSTAGNFGPTESARMKYFNDLKVGGNMMSIHFGHLVDYVLYSLGELSSFTGLLSVQRPKIDILDTDGNKVETMTRTSHDQIMLQGSLKSGAVLSIHERGGAPFKGVPGLIWRIYGEKGEIETTADGSFLQVGYPNMNIRVDEVGKSEVENLDWRSSHESKEAGSLPQPAQNVSRLYEAFARGSKGEWADFDDAVVRHRLLDQLYKSSDTGARTSYL